MNCSELPLRTRKCYKSGFKLTELSDGPRILLPLMKASTKLTLMLSIVGKPWRRPKEVDPTGLCINIVLSWNCFFAPFYCTSGLCEFLWFGLCDCIKKVTSPKEEQSIGPKLRDGPWCLCLFFIICIFEERAISIVHSV
jgi:hypothetical protein